ncbi:CHAP domain-containing protein [Stella sp.]|uniref:CHAP domain-containing protein n=1 Tax=Stella sp. TaxID=2912054 RepID=UPI0035ADD2D8
MLLKRGSSGPEVSRLAERLFRLGYHPGPASATFDDALVRAVKAFQMQNADSVGRPLAVDGIVGPVTAAAIARRLGEAPPVPPAPLPGLAMPPTGGSPTARGALQAALGELAAGHGEVGGNNMGPHVARYLGGILAPPADWCAGFVSWCFRNSGHPMPYPYSLGARDVLKKLRDRGWGVAPSDADPPQPGDVIVWWRGSPGGWKGHVGLVHSYADGIVRTIEGNKTPQVGSFTYTLGAIERLLGFARVP